MPRVERVPGRGRGRGTRGGTKRDGVEAEKLILAVGFDVNRARTVVRPNGTPLPGEPAIGVGPLLPPWVAEGDRPLPWTLTPAGRALDGAPGVVGQNLRGFLPQPAHGRWRNPRSRIRMKLPRGVYSFYVDDLDYGTCEVEILKVVQVIVWTGACDFASGGRMGFVRPDGTRFERPAILTTVRYLEPAGWSLQTAPIVFPGELIVQNLRPSTLKINVLKVGANDGDRVTGHQQQIELTINPRGA